MHVENKGSVNICDTESYHSLRVDKTVQVLKLNYHESDTVVVYLTVTFVFML